jgi:hypothetical protein
MRLVEGLYAAPTPAGTFYAAGNSEPEPGRTMLVNLLCESFQRPISRDSLLAWSAGDDVEQALRVLYRLQRLDFVRGARRPGVVPPKGKLEDLLPPLLSQFSSQGKVVLADDKGFYLASSGYHHEAAEELAALAVDLHKVYERYRRLLRGNLKHASEALALVSPDGRSDLGFWPLHIGPQAFSLIVEGVPNLNQPALVRLVQLLAIRYR